MKDEAMTTLEELRERLEREHSFTQALLLSVLGIQCLDMGAPLLGKLLLLGSTILALLVSINRVLAWWIKRLDRKIAALEKESAE